MRVALLLLGLLWPSLLLAGDPELRWQVLETSRFRLLFNQDTEALVAPTLASANRAFEHLERYYGFVPRQRVDLVLGDDTDAPNGFTFVMPYDRVVLRAVPPRLDDELSGLGSWLDLLVLHELTHVFTLERHSGPAAWLNAVFGRVSLPNVTWPPWFVEGLAVHQESLGGQGRLQHPAFAMKLRMALLEGGAFKLAELSGAPLKHPGAEAWYLYGGYFVSWLAQGRAEGVWGALLADYGGRLIPYAHSILARRHLGRSWPQLYLAFLEALGRVARQQEEALGPALEGQELLWAGEELPHGAPLPDGGLVFVRQDGLDLPRVLRWRDGRLETLWRCQGGCAHLEPASDGRIYFVGSQWADPFRRLLEPMVWSPGEGVRGLGEGLRCRELAWLPQRGSLLCSSWAPDTGHFLLELGPQGVVRKTLLPPAELGAPVLGQARPLPGRPREVLVSVLAAGRRGYALVDLDLGTWRLLEGQAQWVQQPELSPEGRFLVQGRALEGRFQLELVDLEGRCAPRILTRVPGGAFQPRFVEGGKALVYASYHADGYRLFRLEPGPACEAPQAPLAPPAGPASASAARGPGPALPGTARPYFPLWDLRPRSWLPTVSGGSQGLDWVGLELRGTDPTEQESLLTTLYWLPEDAGVQGALRWETRRVFPVLGLNLSHSDRAYEGRQQGRGQPFRYQRSSLGLDLRFRNPSVERVYAVSFGYDLTLWRLSEDAWPLEQDPLLLPGTRAGRGYEGALSLGFVRDGRESWRLAPGPAAGTRLGVSARLASPYFGGQRESLVLRSSLDLHPPLLPGNCALGLFWRGAAAMAPGSVDAFSLGGQPAQDLVQAVVDGGVISSGALRGFAPDSLVGSQYQYGRLEALVPLARPRRGLFTWPVFLKDLLLRPLLNGAWVSGLQGQQPRAGVGAALEAEARLELGYQDPLTLLFGVARGQGEGAVSEAYFLLGR